MEGRSGVITRLAVRSGRPDRTRVYVDGRLAAELATQVVDEARLHEGYRLEEHRLAELLADDEPHRARSRALHMLAGRDRSVAEVRQRLASAGFSASAIASTVEWLSALGYLDDQRFAGRYVHEKVKAGWGERRLRVELTRKGVERKHVEEALAAVHEEEQVVGGQHETLVSLVQRRFARSGWWTVRAANGGSPGSSCGGDSGGTTSLAWCGSWMKATRVLGVPGRATLLDTPEKAPVNSPCVMIGRRRIGPTLLIVINGVE
jgi:regulatory protein